MAVNLLQRRTKMKKLFLISMTVVCLGLSTSCAHKPVASPSEVNDYLNQMCHIAADYGWESAVDGISNYEMHEKMSTMLKSLDDEG